MIHKNVFIGSKAVIGEGCSIQQYAYIPDGVTIGNNVFIGPHVVFTNDKYAPSKGAWRSEPGIVVGDSASIGANSTILPGITIGAWAVVGAGSVVTKNVRSGATVYGNPAKENGGRYGGRE